MKTVRVGSTFGFGEYSFECNKTYSLPDEVADRLLLMKVAIEVEEKKEKPKAKPKAKPKTKKTEKEEK